MEGFADGLCQGFFIALGTGLIVVIILWIRIRKVSEENEDQSD